MLFCSFGIPKLLDIKQCQHRSFFFCFYMYISSFSPTPMFFYFSFHLGSFHFDLSLWRSHLNWGSDDPFRSHNTTHDGNILKYNNINRGLFTVPAYSPREVPRSSASFQIHRRCRYPKAGEEQRWARYLQPVRLHKKAQHGVVFPMLDWLAFVALRPRSHIWGANCQYGISSIYLVPCNVYYCPIVFFPTRGTAYG